MPGSIDMACYCYTLGYPQHPHSTQSIGGTVTVDAVEEGGSIRADSRPGFAEGPGPSWVLGSIWNPLALLRQLSPATPTLTRSDCGGKLGEL